MNCEKRAETTSQVNYSEKNIIIIIIILLKSNGGGRGNKNEPVVFVSYFSSVAFVWVSGGWQLFLLLFSFLFFCRVNKGMGDGFWIRPISASSAQEWGVRGSGTPAAGTGAGAASTVWKIGSVSPAGSSSALSCCYPKWWNSSLASWPVPPASSFKKQKSDEIQRVAPSFNQ